MFNSGDKIFPARDPRPGTIADPLSPVHVDCPTCGADRTARCYDRRANRDSPYTTLGDRGLVDKAGNPRFHAERVRRARALAGGLP